MDEAKDEENNNETNGTSWWGSWPSWLQTAKEKSSTAIEFMKRDISEFTHVVQTDAVAAVSSTAAILKEKLTVDAAEVVAGKARQSITSVLETITDVFAPQRELEDAELMIIKDSEPVAMSWWQSQLYMIQKDPKTFCHEPEGPPEMYENWLESFDCDDHQEEMTKIMVTCSEVQTLYNKLVPTSVSHLEFWQRYFYRVHLLRKAEAKRADLMRRAEQISIEDVQWDKDEDLNSVKKSEAAVVAGSKSANENLKMENPESNKSVSDLASSKTAQTIPKETLENCPDVKKTVHNKQDIMTDISVIDSGVPKDDKKLTSDISADMQNELSSADSTDGSRLSPVESLGKDYSTGDEWEKDFDLEINESDLIKPNSQQPDPQKEEEDDWEKWQ